MSSGTKEQKDAAQYNEALKERDEEAVRYLMEIMSDNEKKSNERETAQKEFNDTRTQQLMEHVERLIQAQQQSQQQTK